MININAAGDGAVASRKEYCYNSYDDNLNYDNQ